MSFSHRDVRLDRSYAYKLVTALTCRAMKCCYSCRFWEKASKSVPIDVRKVVSKDRFFEVEFAGRSAKIPHWEWKLVEPITLKDLRLLRLCMYGTKGTVWPWDECDDYEPKAVDSLTLCQVGRGCMYSGRCAKYSSMTSYIS